MLNKSWLIDLTRKAFELASTATDIGPAVAVAACRSPSLPVGMTTTPAWVAPM